MEQDKIVQYLCAKVGAFYLGVQAEEVIEIVKPNSEGFHHFDGEGKGDSIKYNGEYIPLVYLSDFVKGERDHYISTSKVLISEKNSKRFGLVVDSAEEIIRIPKNEMNLSASDGEDVQFEALDSVLDVEDKKVHIISVDKVFDLVNIDD